MSDAAASWAPQQLAEFPSLRSRSARRDPRGPRGHRRAAESVEAECAALIRGDTVLASVGWLRFDVPERQLIAVAAAREGIVDVPGTGVCPAVALPLEAPRTRT